MCLAKADDSGSRDREGDSQDNEDRREPEKLLMRDAERLEPGFADQAGNEGAEQELGQPCLICAAHGGKAAEAGPAGQRENRCNPVESGSERGFRYFSLNFHRPSVITFDRLFG